MFAISHTFSARTLSSGSSLGTIGSLGKLPSKKGDFLSLFITSNGERDFPSVFFRTVTVELY